MSPSPHRYLKSRNRPTLRDRATRLCLLQPRRTMAVHYRADARGSCETRRRASPGNNVRTRQCWPRAMQNSDLAMVDDESNCTSPRTRTWKFSGFEVPGPSTLLGLRNQTVLSLSIRAWMRPNVLFSRWRETRSDNSPICRCNSTG